MMMTGKKDLLSALMDMLCIWLVGEDKLCGAPRLNHRTKGFRLKTQLQIAVRTLVEHTLRPGDLFGHSSHTLLEQKFCLNHRQSLIMVNF